MHENLHRSLSREEICKYVGRSMPYFNKIFADYMHCTPIAYFLDQKFNWTVQLLKTTSLSIKEIAYKAGFDDPLYFSAQFKKRFGVPPTEYRKHEERMAEQKRRRDYHPCSAPWLH
jgi:AraC-like DNA-binding protein